MSVQQATVGNTVTEETVKDQSESELNKKPLPLTEDEEAFKGPKFYPPVYRRRYAAVCELAKKHQAKKVMSLFCPKFHPSFPVGMGVKYVFKKSPDEILTS